MVLSASGFLGYSVVIGSSFFISWGNYDFMWLLTIVWSVAVTGSKAGSLCRYINTRKTKPFIFLGKYSMTLYMNHLACYYIVNKYFPFLRVEMRVLLFCVMGLAAGLACILLVKQITYVVKKYGHTFKRTFFKEKPIEDMVNAQ